jgi:hypothetical protein
LFAFPAVEDEIKDAAILTPKIPKIINRMGCFESPSLPADDERSSLIQ